jgi:subtilisin family serine protease
LILYLTQRFSWRDYLKFTSPMPRALFPQKEALPEDRFHSAQTMPVQGIDRRGSSVGPLELVRLSPVMERSQGRSEMRVALIDGPVVIDHPELAGATIREIAGTLKGACTRPDTIACTHATFVAGMLSARRGSVAPAICPGCTLLLRPIFGDTVDRKNGQIPSATPEELAEAIIDSVNAGAQVINLSSALMQPSPRGESTLTEALNYAAHRGAITVAASGNQGTVGSSAITRHPWVIAVAACNSHGRPLRESNLGRSIGRRGLSAPGENITSLGTNGEPRTFGGTSAAAPFVTGAIALLWSEFPEARAAEVKLVMTRCGAETRHTLVPPLLNAWAAYQMMASARHGRTGS